MGTATNAKKGTLSFWAKLAKSNNSNEYMRFYIQKNGYEKTKLIS